MTHHRDKDWAKQGWPGVTGNEEAEADPKLNPETIEGMIEDASAEMTKRVLDILDEKDEEDYGDVTGLGHKVSDIDDLWGPAVITENFKAGMQAIRDRKNDNVTPEEVPGLNNTLKDIAENIEDLDPEFSKAIYDNFWDLVDTPKPEEPPLPSMQSRDSIIDECIETIYKCELLGLTNVWRIKLDEAVARLIGMKERIDANKNS